MKNKELFVLNPDDNNLVNDGVVNINTDRKDAKGLQIIRHELRTFVCEGEYQRGLYRILDTYLRFLQQPKQPAVWVSGFFGSGKSHLIKMLGYLWEDFAFPSGETARNLRRLPDDIHEKLVELDRKQKLFGKLVVAGTLKDFPSTDIRYSFLQLLLSTLDLPTQYHLFRFVLWAKQEGLYDDLKSLVEADGKNFDREVQNLFVSSSLANAVLKLRPGFAENEAKVRDAFKFQYKRIDHIGRQDFIKAIKEEILPLHFGNNIPCTLIVLDEVQQFIGQDSNRTNDIQHLAEDICEQFDGKFLLVGSGQNALADTPFISPLQARFSITVNLSDTDVETVTRSTVLEKKNTVFTDLQTKLHGSLGEISRNLSGSCFGYTTEDEKTLVADYPILPSTRKFWKKVLQVIDTAGTSGQLRSQLRIVDESLKKVANEQIGSIVPADLIFEQKQQQMLQNALLLNEINSLIEERKAKGGDSLLEGRILSIVFLLDRLPKDLPGGTPKANEHTIADLLQDNLNGGSTPFRDKVKQLIQKLVSEQLLMPIGDEYKLQTKEGAEWEQEFTAQVSNLQHLGEDKIQEKRKEQFLSHIKNRTGSINILQGISKQQRPFELWDKDTRPNTDNKLNLWIRDGWNENENIVLTEIRAEGTDAPLAYLFISKMREQDLRSEIIKFIAADRTLSIKGIPPTEEGRQAYKSMETRRGFALKAIGDLVENICKEAKVYLAGGTLIDSGSLGENIKEALEQIADRQFLEFKNKADYRDWDKALSQGLGKNPDGLKKIGFNGEPKDHPVAIEILRFLGNQPKQGKEIRANFTKAPYGWSQDAVDAILALLKVTEQISCSEPELKQGNINGAIFKKEVHTLTAGEKLKLRKLYQDLNINCKPGEEFIQSNTLLTKLTELAQKISGQAPLPDAIDLTFLKEIQNLDGNERLARILLEEADLSAKYKAWSQRLQLLEKRMPGWSLIENLYPRLPDSAEALKSECEAIRNDRLLFNEPDPIAPVLGRVSDVLNEELAQVKTAFKTLYDKRMDALQKDEFFSKLSPEDKHLILAKHDLLKAPTITKLQPGALVNELMQASLTTWQTRIHALPRQFDMAREEAVALAAPKAELFSVPKRTLNSEAEIDAYLAELGTTLKELIKKSGAIVLK